LLQPRGQVDTDVECTHADTRSLLDADADDVDEADPIR
jgi:hypothetical protein